MHSGAPHNIQGNNNIAPDFAADSFAEAHKSTEPARKFVRGAMALALLAGGQTYAAEKMNIGPNFRSLRVIAEESVKSREDDWQADLISKRLDTPLGNIQRFPLALVFSKNDLEQDLRGVDSINIAVKALEGKHQRDIAERTITAENLNKPPIANVFADEKSDEQYAIDVLGMHADSKTSIALPLTATGHNWLHITTKHGGTVTIDSQAIADPSEHTCPKSRVIQLNVVSAHAVQSVCKAIKQERPFLRNDPIAVMRLGGTDQQFSVESVNNDRPGVIDLELPFKRDIGAAEVGSAMPRHELAHILFTSLTEAQQQALFERYKELKRAMLYRMPTENEVNGNAYGKYYDVADNEPIWAPITESVYERDLGNQGSLAGHPFSNANEMFASSIAVYSTFGEQFIDQFDALTAQQQTLHRKLFKTITDILRAHASSTTPMNDIERLIPNYWQIYQRLFCTALTKQSISNH